MKLQTSRNGFTLIELLIVTVVIVTLMGVVFRLAGTGSDRRNLAETIDRMQRIENALSGYYAAYGSYPPVPLQGRSRSIYKGVDSYGLQTNGETEDGAKDFNDSRMTAQILAACRAQPVSVSWPSPEGGDVGDSIESFISGFQNAGLGSIDTFKTSGGLELDAVNWRSPQNNGKSVQLFEFGLLSFLFPRYLFMLEADNAFYDHLKNGRLHGQWVANNQLPCRLDTGDPFKKWKEIQDYLGEGSSGSQSGKKQAGMISNLTSQAVCARWMPNFKGIVSTMSQPKYRFFYGVDVYDGRKPYLSIPNSDVTGRKPRISSKNGKSAGSGNDGESGRLLLSMTVCDGWGREFFYYSEPPYQSYRLWSAGPNGKTFPPWYDLSQFTSTEDLNSIHSFIEDDIVHLSN